MANYFKGQKPEKIRQTQLKTKSLFIDPLFPPNNSSLYLRDKAGRGKIVWKRPGASLHKFMVDDNLLLMFYSNRKLFPVPKLSHLP